MKTWEMFKLLTENPKLKMYVVNPEIKKDGYNYISFVNGVLYWNEDLTKGLKVNAFYNFLNIEWSMEVAK